MLDNILSLSFAYKINIFFRLCVYCNHSEPLLLCVFILFFSHFIFFHFESSDDVPSKRSSFFPLLLRLCVCVCVFHSPFQIAFHWCSLVLFSFNFLECTKRNHTKRFCLLNVVSIRTCKSVYKYCGFRISSWLIWLRLLEGCIVVSVNLFHWNCTHSERNIDDHFNAASYQKQHEILLLMHSLAGSHTHAFMKREVKLRWIGVSFFWNDRTK